MANITIDQLENFAARADERLDKLEERALNGPDWEENDSTAPGYIKNRTHYSEETTATTKTELLAEATVSFDVDEDVYVLSDTVELTAGETYDVTWNGTEYTCVAQDVSAHISGWNVALGDLSDIGEGNGEPFIIRWTESKLIATAVDGSTDEVTVAIHHLQQETQEVVHRIPTKFLPASVPWVEDGGRVEILSETTIVTTDDQNVLPVRLGLVPGNSYVVVFNSEEYNCVCQAVDVEDGVICGCLGDVYTMSDGNLGTAATGEPFAIIAYPDEFAAEMGAEGIFIAVPIDDSTSFTLSIYQSGDTINKLDSRCLDLAWLPTVDEQELVPETTIDGTYIKLDYRLNLTVGASYIVTWNGTKYTVECTLYNDAYPSLAVENVFLVLCMDDYDEVMHLDGGAGATFSIVGYVPNKMPEKFLPESVVKNGDLELVMVSEPDIDGNYKRYKITVTYDGALTVTEITE